MGVEYEPSVPLSMLRGLIDAAERGGVSRAALLSAARIDPRELIAPDARITRARFRGACEAALALTGDEALGLHWAEHLMPRSFGPVIEGLSHASTLRHAFHLLARFERFFTSAAGHQLYEDSDHATVRIAPAVEGSLEVRRLLAEMSVAWFVKLIRSLCADAELTRIDFGFAPPSYADEYARVFAAPIGFARPSTEIVLARTWLDVPSAQAEAVARAAEPASPDVVRPNHCAEQLHALILARGPRRLSMPDAARALGLGERSLRRRLAAEGRTYKEIEFAALAEVAKQLLHDEQRTIQETAFEMGFSGPNAFHRAFKRWTGSAPSNFQTRASAATQR